MTVSASQPPSDIPQSVTAKTTTPEFSDSSKLQDIDPGLYKQLQDAKEKSQQAQTQADRIEPAGYLTTTQEAFISQPFLDIAKFLYVVLSILSLSLYVLTTSLCNIIPGELIDRVYNVIGFVVIPLLALLLGYYLGLSSRRLIK